MATDLIKILQEIRGTGVPEVVPTDGMYWDLTIALTGPSNANGKYGHIVEMYGELAAPGGSYDDFVTKYADFLVKYADVLVQTGVATDAADLAVIAQTAAEGYALNAATSSADVAARLDTVQGNGDTVETNLNAVASNAISINKVSSIDIEVTKVATINTEVVTTAGAVPGITVVANKIAPIEVVVDHITAIDEVALHTTAVEAVAAVSTEVNSLGSEPALTALLTAEVNAFKSEREAWEAEAEKRTATSYAIEPAWVFVKLWSSVGNGTFTYINSSVYSSLHYSKITAGAHKFIGYFDAGAALTLPVDGDEGEFYIVSVAGDVNGTVTRLDVGDELRWNVNTTSWTAYRIKLEFDRLLSVPENVSNAQSRSEKGLADGYAPLNTSTLIDAAYLPSYVDDVIEVPTYASLPTTGESGKIYIVVADETQGGNTSTYRWTGSVYALVSNTMTAADIKDLYESNTNTNVFTDTEKASVDISTGLTTTAQTLPTAVNEVNAALDLKFDKTGGPIVGSITVTGTVDGRDVSTDGTKLDGIESGATADQNAGEIKSLYEGNADTNNFSDAQVTKLSGIEVGATADQTPSELLTAIKTVDGTSSGLDADLLDGQDADDFETAFNSTIQGEI